MAIEIGDYPYVWTCGSLESFSLAGFSVAGAGVYLPAPELAMQGTVWGEVEDYGDAGLDRCGAFVPVPGPLQTLQRAEFWGTMMTGFLAGVLGRG